MRLVLCQQLYVPKVARVTNTESGNHDIRRALLLYDYISVALQ